MAENKGILPSSTFNTLGNNSNKWEAVYAKKLVGPLTGNVTGNVSGSSGSCTGNSATATKATQDSAGQQINSTYIKGLSISGKTITYTKGNGSTGSITVPTGANAGDIMNIINTQGLSHNGIYRGKDWGTLTSLSEVEQFLSDHGVSTGLFKDLYLGDYFVLQDGTYNKTWEIAGFDMYYNNGAGAGIVKSTHHLNLIPRSNLFGSKMNNTNDTTGGYYNSYMHQTVIPQVDTNMEKILGNHLLIRVAWLTNAVNKDLDSNCGPGWTGASSDGSWYNVKSVLMNEMNIWGAPIRSSSSYDNAGYPHKLPIFNLRNYIYNANEMFWLRCVGSDSRFITVDIAGAPCSEPASFAYGGVRPLICVG